MFPGNDIGRVSYEHRLFRLLRKFRLVYALQTRARVEIWKKRERERKRGDCYIELESFRTVFSANKLFLSDLRKLENLSCNYNN